MIVLEEDEIGGVEREDGGGDLRRGEGGGGGGELGHNLCGCEGLWKEK